MEEAVDSNDIFIEALEVFINSILYTRDIYPQEIFRKTNIYNTTVYVSTYPPLNDYLFKILKSAKELKEAKELYKIEVVVYKDENNIYEIFVFEIDDKNPLMYEQKSNNDKYLVEFEEELRKSLLKLSARVKPLKKLPKDAKFKVQLHTTQSGFVKMCSKAALQDFPWLQEAENSLRSRSQVSILPLTAANSVGLQIYAELF